MHEYCVGNNKVLFFPQGPSIVLLKVPFHHHYLLQVSLVMLSSPTSLRQNQFCVVLEPHLEPLALHTEILTKRVMITKNKIIDHIGGLLLIPSCCLP